MPLVEQELLTLPEHLNSPSVFSGVHVTRSLVLRVCFIYRCLYFFFWPLCCLFFFDIQILITSLWYLETLLIIKQIFSQTHMYIFCLHHFTERIVFILVKTNSHQIQRKLFVLNFIYIVIMRKK